MNKKELLLVCGISGAGKSVTMNYLESSGYYCIDNLPVNALVGAIKALNQDEHFLKYAIAINSNATEETIQTTLNDLKVFEWLEIKILYLDISDDEVLKRFQLTRKQHPFSNRNETLIEAIKQERELLFTLRQHATIIIDTSEYTEKRLRATLSKIFDKEIVPEFRICFVSFGYKHGIPKDLDYAFDVRFLPNPYYIEELREKTGNDIDVYNYVMEQDQTKEFVEKLTPFLNYSIRKQKETNRSYLVIGIGCTGGQHRSVSICNYLAEHYKNEYSIIRDHRDVKTA